MAKVDLLTAAKVKSLKAPGDYLDGRGLYLQVRSESSKSWLLKFSLHKRPREMGLGSAFDFSQADQAGHRPDRPAPRRRTHAPPRSGEVDHLSRSVRTLHRGEPRRLEKHQ